jgi:hypothetical protein
MNTTTTRKATLMSTISTGTPATPATDAQLQVLRNLTADFPAADYTLRVACEVVRNLLATPEVFTQDRAQSAIDYLLDQYRQYGERVAAGTTTDEDVWAAARSHAARQQDLAYKTEYAAREQEQEQAAYRAEYENDRADEREASRPANPATPKQIAFITRLLNEKNVPAATAEIIQHRIDTEAYSRKDASGAIDLLIGLSSKPNTDAVTEPGMYRTPAGTFYKVQASKSGNLYAKAATVTAHDDGTATVTFDYAPGAIRDLTAQMRLTLEDAAQFGMQYGTCIVCGRTLTHPTSVAAGIGPVCSGRV